MPGKKRRGRGEGEIRQLPSGKWRARLSYTDPVSKERQRPGKTFDSKEEAVRWKAQQIREGSAKAGTFGGWLDTWLPLHKSRVSSGAHRTDRQTAEKHLRPNLGAVRLRDLTPLRCEQFLAGLAASQGERHKAGKVLRNVLNAAVRAGMLPANPMKQVRVPAAPKPKARSLTPAELGRLLAAARVAGHGALFELWAELGLRPGELIGLRWEDYDAGKGTVEVVRTVEYTTGRVRPPKTPRESPLPLSAGTIATLEAYRKGAMSGVMFPTRSGRHWWPKGFLERIWRPVCRKAGVRGPRNILRHTMASIALAGGASIVGVSKRLGHSSPAFTLRTYSHAMPNDQDKITSIVGQLIHSVG